MFNPLKTKRRLLYLKTKFVPRSENVISVMKTNQFMLYVAQVAAYSEINTKHINTVRAEYHFFSFKPVDARNP